MPCRRHVHALAASGLVALLALQPMPLGHAQGPSSPAGPRSAAVPQQGEGVGRGGPSVIGSAQGRGVWAVAVIRTGPVTSLGLSNNDDGTVYFSGAKDTRSSVALHGRRSPSSPTPDSPECSEDAFALYSSSWANTYAWYFDAGTTPPGISHAGAAGALQAAVANITGARNDCGLPDRVGATGDYMGTTTSKPNVSSSGECKSSDGQSSVGFGTLPPAYLAYTCWWSAGSNTIEADIKLNKSDYGWYATMPSTCSSRWDIEAVATHEFGHAFGLDHVEEASQGALTMSPTIYPCQGSEETLGMGDVLGLESKY